MLWNSSGPGSNIYPYLMIHNSDSYYWNFINFKAIYGFVRVSLISWCISWETNNKSSWSEDDLRSWQTNLRSSKDNGFLRRMGTPCRLFAPLSVRDTRVLWQFFRTSGEKDSIWFAMPDKSVNAVVLVTKSTASGMDTLCTLDSKLQGF